MMKRRIAALICWAAAGSLFITLSGALLAIPDIAPAVAGLPVNYRASFIIVYAIGLGACCIAGVLIIVIGGANWQREDNG